MPKQQSRRDFLKTGVAASAPLFLPSFLSAASPNGKLNHAVVGCDGQGWSDLSQIASHKKVHIAAICDVDKARMAKAIKQFPEARQYQDWREMLEKEGDKIDSVQVAIPDHMHAPVSLAAMERGKHVYCQKPLAHSVNEVQAMQKKAAEKKVVTQMGNQIQSHNFYRTAVQMIQDGVIGKVKEVHAWSGARFGNTARPEKADPIPATLNWDQWLGVAEARPYVNGIYHPFNWRSWKHFGTGGLGDFMCHIMDTPHKALELAAPLAVQCHKVSDQWAKNEAFQKESWPISARYEYLYKGTKWTEGKTIKTFWYDGGERPDPELAGFELEGRKLPGGGSLFIGETANFVVPHVGQPLLIPNAKNKGAKRPKLAPRSHYHSFVDAIFGKDKTTSHFGFAGPLAEATALGNIANHFPGTALQWDSAKMEFANHAEATKLATREYRKGW